MNASHPPKGIRRAKVGDFIRLCLDSNGIDGPCLSHARYRVEEIASNGYPHRLSVLVGELKYTVPVRHPSRLKFIFVSP